MQGHDLASTIPPVVGIGASAGGLAALKRFFAYTPADTDLAYVVVMHLLSEQPSALAELLQPHSAMPVRQVTDGMPLEANRVYVIPPGNNLAMIDGQLRLTPLDESRDEHASIDRFFETLVQSCAEHCVAVVLSGSGTDGSIGLNRVKEQGGLTIAQEPGEAESDSMPRSAIASGRVDLILPVQAMADHIVRFLRTRPDLAQADVSPEPAERERTHLQGILAQVQARSGHDFSDYKLSTVLRRIHRRMQLNHTEDLGVYLERLRQDDSEVRALGDELLITVTQFFRDPKTFAHIEKRVIPKLFEGKRANDSVRVWSVGCATGEEAYSLAILLLEQASRCDHPPKLEVFASDAHENSLQTAREGRYTDAIAGCVSRKRLRQFFSEENGAYRVNRIVREIVVFANHNLLKDPPFSRLDLIVCRNLLIYLKREMQQKVIELFHYALKPGGRLWLGSAESTERGGLFEVESKQDALYRRRDVPPPEPSLPVFPNTLRPTTHEATGQALGMSYGMMHQRMVERFAPPSILVDQDLRVVHISEHAGRYLHLPGGEPSANILKLVLEPLRVELQAALYRARETGTTQRTDVVALDLDGEARQIVVQVRPAQNDMLGGLILVLFDERPAGKAQEGTEASAEVPREDVSELMHARERLRAVIEQYETSQEEMKAANEELQSTNEELRSTMEELETSKEELQSMNEELKTANEENQHKVAELSQMSADLHNLIAASDIATLFLDRSLQIMWITPRASELFNIRASDRGRPLSELHRLVAYGQLEEDAQRVLEKLTPVERQIQGPSGTWFLSRVLPYRSSEEQIQGVVITLVDITEHKNAELALGRSEARLRALVEASSDVIYRISPDWAEMRYLVSPNFISDAAEPSRDWLTKYIPKDEQPKVRQAIADAIEGKRMYELEHRVLRGDGTIGWTLSRAVPILGASGEIVEWFGMAADITARKQSEEALRDLTQNLEHQVAERSAHVERQAGQLRALTSDLSRAEQRERKRLARILHDDVQQLIVGARIQIQALQLEADGEGRDATTLRIEQILDEALRTTRSLAVELSPPMLDETGLIGALKWLVPRLKGQLRLRVLLHADPAAEPADDDLRLLLFDCVRELLLNAAKHAGVDEAEVALTRSSPTEITVLVSDAGRGFEPDRLHETQRADVGLGLFGIRERLAHLGGRMVIDSAPGRGTRVRLVVPASGTEPTVDGPRSDATTSHGAGRARRRAAHCRVLIVDDHPIVREALSLQLKTAQDIEVVGQAEDGPQGIEMARSLRPDVVLMDVNLGDDIDGIEATRRILAVQPEILVIGLSIHNEPAVADAMRDAGAMAYVKKDAGAALLIEQIHACWKEGSGDD
jgi:two-component system CheB/CheR fusion protein